MDDEKEFEEWFTQKLQDSGTDFSDDFYAEMSTWSLDDVTQFSRLCERLRHSMVERYAEEILLMNPDAVEEGECAADCFWNVAAASDRPDVLQVTMVLNAAAIIAGDVMENKEAS